MIITHRPPIRPTLGHKLFVADLSLGLVFNYKNTKLAYAFA
ncbi:hypothetical protein [Prosthecobacter sp.]|nr:hypothetical protein [Prosthecobacter sp.]MDZ4401788.1 hypothetical protein [Prosthecobacter sp.]